MEDQMTRLRDTQEAVLWAVVLCGVSAARAGLAGLVGLHLDHHAPRLAASRLAAGEQRLVGNIGLQLCERPLSDGLSRLPCMRFLRSRMWVRSSKPMRACG